jgi:hypothetical protein
MSGFPGPVDAEEQFWADSLEKTVNQAFPFVIEADGELDDVLRC